MQNHKPIIFVFTLAIITVFLFALSYKAFSFGEDIIPSQINHSSTGVVNTSNYAHYFLQQLGTGYSGTLTGLSMYFNATTSDSGAERIITIYSINGNDIDDVEKYENFTEGQGGGYNTLVEEFHGESSPPYNGTAKYNNGQSGIVVATSTMFISLNTNKYYWIEIGDTANSTDVYVMGISNYSYSGGFINPLETNISAPYLLFTRTF